MRTLRDLDDEIGRAERRLAARRKHLNESLAVSRTRTRVSLASPKVLAAAFAAGFLLDRLGRLRPRSKRAERKGSAGSGIVAALAAAALRAVLGNPKVWSSLRDMWAKRSAVKWHEPVKAPAVRQASPAALERAPYEEPLSHGRAQASAPSGTAATRTTASSYGVASAQR